MTLHLFLTDLARSNYQGVCSHGVTSRFTPKGEAHSYSNSSPGEKPPGLLSGRLM